MNKKIFGAIVCIGLLALCAIPVIDASESPLDVTIRRGFQRGVTVYINNSGDSTLENVTYEIKVTRNGILNRGIFSRQIGNLTGKIDLLGPGEEVNLTANTSAFLWTFFIRATVNVTADGLAEPVIKSVKGVALLGFTRLRRIQILP